MATSAIPEVTAPVTTPSEGAAPSTPVIETTPVTTPVAAPVTPEADIVDGAAFLRDKAAKLTIPGVERPEVVKTPEQIEAEQKVAADVKAAADAKAAETKTEEEKAAEKVKEDATKIPNPLDKLGPIPAEKIGEALKNPEFVATCEKFGIEAAALPEMARDAAEAGMYREVAPTVEAAKYAVENADHFYAIEEKFPAVKDNASLDDFMTTVALPLSYIRDAQGNPIPDPENPGAFKTDGSISQFTTTVVNYDSEWSTNIAQKWAASSEKSGNEDDAAYYAGLQEALKMYDEFRAAGYRRPSEKPAEPSPEVKAELDRLRARDAEVSQQQAEVVKQRSSILYEGVNTDTISGTQPKISDLLNNTSLTDELKTQAGKEIWSVVLGKLQSREDPAGKAYLPIRNFYQNHIDSALKNAKNDAEFQTAAKPWYDKLVALNVTTLNRVLYAPGGKGVVQSILDKYGAQRISAQQARDQKIAGQIKNDTMNAGVKTAGSTNAAKPLSGDELWNKATEIARAENGGREPDGGAILRAKLALQSKSA